MRFMEELSQFSVGLTEQSITCSIKEKPHTGLDDCLRILLSCFRKKMSVWQSCTPTLTHRRHKCLTRVRIEVDLCPGAHDERDGVGPEAEHEHHDDHVLDRDLRESGDAFDLKDHLSVINLPGSPSDLNTGNGTEGATGCPSWCRPLRPLFHYLCSNLKANPV